MTSPLDLFAASIEVDPNTGDWLWLGDDLFEGKKPHVWIWEEVHGPLEPGFTPRRQCECRACVNPEHMVQARTKTKAQELAVTTAIPDVDRCARVVALAAEGRRTSEIAHALDISERTVLRDLAAFEHASRNAAADVMERHRRIMHERLEMVIDDGFDRMQAGSKGARRAAQTVLKAMEQQAKLLGLNAPDKKAIEHSGGTEVDMRAFSDAELQKAKAEIKATIESVEAEEKEAKAGADVIAIAEWSETR